MGRYSISNDVPDQAILQLNTPSRRAKVYGIMVMVTGVTIPCEFRLSRLLIAGILGTDLTEAKLDPLSVNASGVGMGPVFVIQTPVFGSTLLMFGTPVDTVFKWTSKRNNSIVTNIGSDAGVGIEFLQGTAQNVRATMMWEE